MVCVSYGPDFLAGEGFVGEGCFSPRADQLVFAVHVGDDGSGVALTHVAVTFGLASVGVEVGEVGGAVGFPYGFAGEFVEGD